jgi:hypothetical protein
MSKKVYLLIIVFAILAILITNMSKEKIVMIEKEDYLLKTQNNSTHFITGKTDYEIRVNRKIISDNDINVILKFNNQLYHLHNSYYNNLAIKYSDRPYLIDNHFIDENGNSIVTMWGFLSKNLEKMILYVEYNSEKCVLYMPAADENDVKEIHRKIFVEVD